MVDATTANTKEKNDNTKNGKETMKLKIKLNLNNVPPGIQKLKLVSYVNGEAKEQYIDLSKDKSKTVDNILVLNQFYDKSNDVSSIIVTDQYFVCAYAINPKQKGVSFYDCDEGNIGSPD